MKRFFSRGITLLLALLLLLSACTAPPSPPLPPATPPASDEGTPPPDETPILATVYPEIRVSALVYPLPAADGAAFDATHAALTAIVARNDAGEVNDYLASLYKLNSLKVAYDAQRDIAELLYSCHPTDKTAQKNTGDAEAAYLDVHRRFWDLLGDARAEGCVFADVTHAFVREEYPTATTATKGTATYAQMTALANELYAFNQSATREEAFPIYSRYLSLAHTYATLNGYTNFYEHQNAVAYGRDSTRLDRTRLRAYVKEYLVPLYREKRDEYHALYASLSRKERILSNRYLDDAYDSLDTDLLGAYFSSLPDDVREAMSGAFALDRVLIPKDDTAYVSAYVQTVGNTPVCYFHPTLTDLVTVSHELGHYYAHAANDTLDGASYDLRETHSQANTLLMLSYLESTLDDRAFSAARAYAVSNLMYQAIVCTIRDEFEETLFKRGGTTLSSPDEIDAIMADLIEEYDVADLSSNITAQLMTFWHRQGLSSPGYYISYTASFVVAYQIYLLSLTDYEAAVAAYQALTENIEEDATFLATVRAAGLSSPFAETTYQDLE